MNRAKSIPCEFAYSRLMTGTNFYIRGWGGGQYSILLTLPQHPGSEEVNHMVSEEQSWALRSSPPASHMVTSLPHTLQTISHKGTVIVLSASFWHISKEEERSHLLAWTEEPHGIKTTLNFQISILNTKFYSLE